MLILGAHMSIAGGFYKAAEQTGQELQCTAMQIFTKSPRGGSIKPIDPLDAEKFKALCRKYRINHVFAHSSYLLNFGTPIKKAYWMYQNIRADFDRLHLLGGQGVVVHVGKALNGERKGAIKNIVENAKYVLDRSQDKPLQYILENTAGQGTEVGFQLEEFAEIWDGLKNESDRIKTCIDTAHLWAAGYDLSTPESVSSIFKKYDEMIGLKNVACIHFNDSKKEKGSRLDRHENLGDGKIGIEGLKVVAEIAVEKSIPLILETPEENKTHLDDVRIVKSWNL